MKVDHEVSKVFFSFGWIFIFIIIFESSLHPRELRQDELKSEEVELVVCMALKSVNRIGMSEIPIQVLTRLRIVIMIGVHLSVSLILNPWYLL